jgi:hypothetical protein
LLKPLLPRYPELFTIFHNISKYSATQEDHVLPPRGIFNLDLEFL